MLCITFDNFGGAAGDLLPGLSAGIPAASGPPTTGSAWSWGIRAS